MRPNIAADCRRVKSLFIEIPGGEWEGEAEGAVPVFPVVDSVTDAELRFDLGLLHFHVQLEGESDQEVVVTAVDEPFDGP